MICALLPPLLMTDYITLKACLLEEVNTNDWWPLAQLLIAWLQLNSFVYIVSQSLHIDFPNNSVNRIEIKIPFSEKQAQTALTVSWVQLQALLMYLQSWSHRSGTVLFYASNPIYFTDVFVAGRTNVGDIFEAIHTEGDQATSSQTPVPETKQWQCKCSLLFSHCRNFVFGSSVLSSLIACLADSDTERNSLNNEEQLQYNMYIWGIIQGLFLKSDLSS